MSLYSKKDMEADEHIRLVNGLVRVQRIRTTQVERAFRAAGKPVYSRPVSHTRVLRQHMCCEAGVHVALASPCITAEVLELLELKPGMSFLNIGCGAGFMNLLAGLILGSAGVNHGIDIDAITLEKANKTLVEFLDTSPALDEFDLCVPTYYRGNALCLGPNQKPYDRVYCGAQCPIECVEYLMSLVKMGGILVVPITYKLMQIQRPIPDLTDRRYLMNVLYCDIVMPADEDETFTIDVPFPRLQTLAFSAARRSMRAALKSRTVTACAWKPVLRAPRITQHDIAELLRHVYGVKKIPALRASEQPSGTQDRMKIMHVPSSSKRGL